MAIKVTAPVRIDISGGWPDSDPYRKDNGGAVLNAAINQRVSGYFAGNLFITNPEKVPSHSGLGTSGALRAVEIAASNLERLEDKIDLIRRVYMFENEIIGHRAGFQDEAAAIFGGVNYWEFGNGDSKKTPVNISRTSIPENQARHLEDHLVLVFTGDIHLSANIHDLVFGDKNYERNTPALNRMKQIAGEMKENLTNAEKMGNLIRETWDLQKSLHPSIETDMMKVLQNSAKGSYLGARAIGAGGGGCMIFYSEEKKEFTDSLKGIIKNLDLRGVEVMPLSFDYEGIKIEPIQELSHQF